MSVTRRVRLSEVRNTDMFGPNPPVDPPDPEPDLCEFCLRLPVDAFEEPFCSLECAARAEEWGA